MSAGSGGRPPGTGDGGCVSPGTRDAGGRAEPFPRPAPALGFASRARLSRWIPSAGPASQARGRRGAQRVGSLSRGPWAGAEKPAGTPLLCPPGTVCGRPVDVPEGGHRGADPAGTPPDRQGGRRSCPKCSRLGSANAPVTAGVMLSVPPALPGPSQGWTDLAIRSDSFLPPLPVAPPWAGVLRRERRAARGW